jgi:hypothetical protein
VQFDAIVPTVLDRFVQQAVMQVLQRQWDSTFSAGPHWLHEVKYDAYAGRWRAQFAADARSSGPVLGSPSKSPTRAQRHRHPLGCRRRRSLRRYSEELVALASKAEKKERFESTVLHELVHLVRNITNNPEGRRGRRTVRDLGLWCFAVHL